MKIFEEIKILIKLRSLIKNFDMKNWKTSLAGLVVFGLMVAPKITSNPLILEICAVLKDVALATGLLAAKDFNVSGQPSNPLKP